SASQTQPVPSIAECFDGSARTAKIGEAGALMISVALTQSSAIAEPPYRRARADDMAARPEGVFSPTQANRCNSMPVRVRVRPRYQSSITETVVTATDATA